MEAYLSRSPADCAAAFKLSAGNAAKYTSPFLVFAQNFDAFLNSAGFRLIGVYSTFALYGIWILMGVFFFVVGALINAGTGLALWYVPGIIITAAGPTIWQMFFNTLIPSIPHVINMHLLEMDGSYQCAIGEDGFTDAGYLEFKKTTAWIKAILASYEVFGSFEFGNLLSNYAFIADFDTIMLAYAE